jgi:hypothetical protein
MAETVEELTPLKQKLEDFGQFLSKARVPHTAPGVAHAHVLPMLCDCPG